MRFVLIAGTRRVEPLFDLLLEFALQLVVELLAEVGLRTTAGRQTGPWLAVAGYAVLGALCGMVSLWALPALILRPGEWRWVNLVVTPVAVGFVMAAVGRWRQDRAQRTIRLDRFACGYVFALAMAIVRFAGGS